MEESFQAKISVQQILWNGWAIKTGDSPLDTKPPQEIEVKKGQQLDMSYLGPRSAEVKEITETGIVLFTETLVRKEEGKGISLHAQPLEINLKVGETATLMTPTMDAGSKWEIKLLSCQKGEASSSNMFNHDPKGYKPNLVKVKTPKIYFPETQKIIGELENKLNTKLLIYYLPVKYWISQEHPDFFLDLLKDIGHQEKLSLVIYSNGGDSMASLRIASLLRNYCNNLEVIVPSMCISAATNLALAAEKIIFTPSGYLGPIDSQVVDIKDKSLADYSFSQVSMNSFKRAHELLEKEGPVKNNEGEEEGSYRTLFKYINPLIFSEVDRYSKKSKLAAETIMKMHPDSFESEEKIEQIANHLVYDYPTHGFPILFDEAKKIGLPVEKTDSEVSYLLWDLLKFYRAFTRAASTHLNPGFYHIEEYSVAIETSDLRISNNYSFNRRFNPATKSWNVENDNSQWVKIIPSDSGDKPYVRMPIELNETAEVVKNIQETNKKPETEAPNQAQTEISDK